MASPTLAMVERVPFVGLPMINRLYAIDVFRDDQWEPYGQLAISSQQAVLAGTALTNVKRLSATNSVAFGTGGHCGRLYFSADGSSCTGLIVLPDGSQVLASGREPGQVFATERAPKGSATFAPWRNFGYSVDYEGTGINRRPVATFTLGNDDITDRTAVTDITAGVTTISMVPSTVLMGPTDSFSIAVGVDARSFSGTYTDGNGQQYDWRGRETDQSVGARYATANSFAVTPSATTAAVPGPAPALTVGQLMTVSSIYAVQVNGDTKVVDQAQTQAGRYFQQILVASLQEPWLTRFFGGPPTLPDGVTAIQKRYAPFYTKAATLNLGQMLSIQFKNDPREASSIAKIDTDKMAAAWKAYGKDKDYGMQSNDLYVQAYGDAVADIQPFLQNNPQQWAKALHDQLTSEDWLTLFGVQVASGTYKNVRQQMYEWYVQMLVLNPNGHDDAQDVLSQLFSVVVGAQFNQLTWDGSLRPYLEQILQNMISGDSSGMYGDTLRQEELAALRAEINELVTTYGNVVKLADDIFIALEAAAARARLNNQNNLAAIAGGAYAQLQQGQNATAWERFKAGDGPRVLGAIAYGAAAGFFLYSLISGASSPQTPAQVLLELNMGLLALGALIKGVEKLMATRLGTWFTQLADQGVTRLTRAIGTIGKWFTADGLQITNPLVKAIFTEKAETFMAKRFAPALALFALAITAYSIYNDVMNGDVQDIVFDSLNIVVGVLDAIAIGLEIASVGAGPFGLIVAAVGALIGFIQFLVDMFHPPPPPPDPIQQFVEGPLTDAGFAKA
jgi:hypothetical protein